MEQFILVSSMIIESDGEVDVCLKPSSALISDYIATYKVFVDEATAIAETPDLIIEMTPLLFAQFQAMDNVPQSIRDQFTL
jgi:hypothetical protein